MMYGAGHSGLQGAGMQILHPDHPAHFSNRLDHLEAELHHLKSVRAAQSGAVSPMQMTPHGSPVMQFTGPMDMSQMSMHSSSSQQQLFMPMSRPAPAIAPAPQIAHNAMMGAYQSSGISQEHAEILKTHQDIMGSLKTSDDHHKSFLAAHEALMKVHKNVMQSGFSIGGAAKGGAKALGDKPAAGKKHPSLGVVRLDYNYPPASGDTDCPASFGYDVTYRVCPGLTFEMAQAGRFTEKVERSFAEAIKFLEAKGVAAITGDCGFMMAFQVLARKIATKPVFMSSMVQCPIIAAAYDPGDQILVLTANGATLKPQKEVLLNSCGFDVNEDRFLIYGCQDIPGFDAVAKGEAVPLEVVQPGIVKMTLDIMNKHPKINAILLECTELPPYADALRASTGLAVWDAITAADFYINANKDNPRFGLNDWQAEWDGEQDDYTFGANLIEKDKAALVNKPLAKGKAKAKAKSKAAAAKVKKNLIKKQAPVLGVVRLDYNYPPAAGDIDCPASYDYDVIYRMVPGLTFEMAQSGRMTHQVRQEFITAIKYLESKGACGITGDCGFMMAFQPLARDVAQVPVFMSSMVQCPMISVAFDKYDKILILTANSETLKPQKEQLLSHCGFDVDDDRFIIKGCQDIPGFDAVEKGQKVDVEFVTPGMVKMVKGLLDQQPNIRAICLECTELPPYSDALRANFGLPVFDAITCADFFISARKDNPRFGLNEWQNPWDGTVDEYKLGSNLTASQRERAQFV